MSVKTKTITKVIELENINWELEGDDVYWLIGVISATTDGTGRKLYNELKNAVAAATGENGDFIHKNNPIARDARSMARGYRLEDGNSNSVTFIYDGATRVINDFKIKGDLLTGFEVSKNGFPSNQIKSYRLDRIGKPASLRPFLRSATRH